MCQIFYSRTKYIINYRVRILEYKNISLKNDLNLNCNLNRNNNTPFPFKLPIDKTNLRTPDMDFADFENFAH